jgi:CheY-like chemotaxis protein
MSDLTMPGMDGFTLVEQLKHDPLTADIPVVIVSAKTLTQHEMARLGEVSDSVWMKSGFDTRQLVDHIVRALGDEPPTPKSQPREKLARTETVIEGAARSVVIVDDSPSDSRFARRMLELARHDMPLRVTEARSGRDGLRAIYEQHPDLVLLDLTLPDMDGTAILDTIQNDAELRDTPIILFTGRDLSSEELSAYKDVVRSTIEKASTKRDEFILRIVEALK